MGKVKAAREGGEEENGNGKKEKGGEWGRGGGKGRGKEGEMQADLCYALDPAESV